MDSSFEKEFIRIMDELKDARMPFGKFGPDAFPPRGLHLYDLPYEYLAWFSRQGFPKGKLGDLMAFVYQAKQDGAEGMFDVFRDHHKRPSLRQKKSIIVNLPSGPKDLKK